MGYGIFFLCTALSVVCGCVLAAFGFKKRGIPASAAAAAIALSVLLGPAGARLYYIAAVELPSGSLGETAFFFDAPYGYAACGAVLGFIAGCALASLSGRISPGRLLDAAVPGGMAVLVLERIAEVFADSAWGDEILEERWQFFPVALEDGYGSWYGAVNLLEAALALAVLAVFFTRRCQREGSRFALMLLWWSMGQILCESLRAETVRWGFVRVQQIQCAVFGAAVLLWALRGMRAGRKTYAFHLGLYLAGVGAVIALEFILDRLSWPKILDYLLMAAVLCTMGAEVQSAVKKSERA